MRRFVAATLLSVLLAALLAPAAVAMPVSQAAHACCRRAQQHHCDGDAAVEHDHSYIRAARSCCSDPVRALAVTAPATAQPRAASFTAPCDPHPSVTEFALVFAAEAAAEGRHERAPPTTSVR